MYKNKDQTHAEYKSRVLQLMDLFRGKIIRCSTSHVNHATKTVCIDLAVFSEDVPKKGSSLFWDVTRRRLVVGYLRFGTTYRSHLQGQAVKKARSINCPKTIVINCHRTLEDRIHIPKRR
jgi:hypothetical protein